MHAGSHDGVLVHRHYIKHSDNRAWQLRPQDAAEQRYETLRNTGQARKELAGVEIDGQPSPFVSHLHSARRQRPCPFCASVPAVQGESAEPAQGGRTPAKLVELLQNEGSAAALGPRPDVIDSIGSGLVFMTSSAAGSSSAAAASKKRKDP